MMCDVMDNNKGKGKRKKKKDPVLEEEIQRMFQHDSLLSGKSLICVQQLLFHFGGSC